MFWYSAILLVSFSSYNYWRTWSSLESSTIITNNEYTKEELTAGFTRDIVFL